MSLEAKKMLEYIWVPEIMPDDQVRKGQTKLNMFSVLDEQIKSLISKHSKLNFWNQLNPKFAFLCRLLTQTATWQPNHQIMTSSFTAILNAMTGTFFLGPTLRVVRFFYLPFEVPDTRIPRFLGHKFGVVPWISI